jgi:ribosomal protein S18 acetylase RimI-like enzyme
MDELEYMPAGELSLAELADAFNAAFEGYLVPMHHTAESLATMVQTNDIRLGESLVARRAGALVGLVLLGVRGTRGWVGGMAVTPPWRGQGVGTALLRALIARAGALGLAALQLEVLDENTTARRLYDRLGFVETRPLVVYTGPAARPADSQTPDARLAVVALPVAQALANFAPLHVTAPPWQRERDSLLHMAPTLSAIGLRDAAGLRANLLWMPTGGGYSLLDFGARAADAATRAQDARMLLTSLLAADPRAPLRAINVPPGDALGAALDALGCPIYATQREMLLRLK